MKGRGYTTSLATQITGFSPRQLEYWANQGIVVPSIAHPRRRGKPRIYAFDDLVQLRFIARLKKHGWSTQKIREAVERLKDVMDDPYPLKTAVVLNGHKTLLALCKTKEGERVLLDVLSTGRQQVMSIVLEVLETQTQSAVENSKVTELSTRGSDMLRSSA